MTRLHSPLSLILRAWLCQRRPCGRLAKLITGEPKAPPLFYMEEEIKMLLKSSDFYTKESKKLLKKTKNAKTKKEKENAVKELTHIREKIKFEINQINKILEEGESPYGSEYSG